MPDLEARTEGRLADRPAKLDEIPGSEFALAVQDQSDTTELRLSGLKISGDVALEHREICRPVTLTNCVFDGQLSLSGSHVRGAFRVVDCTFLGDFHCGSADEPASTTFDRAVDFRDSVFHADVSLLNAVFQNTLVLTRCAQLSRAGSVDLSNTQIETILKIDDCHIEGGANFTLMSCGQGVEIKNSTFAAPDSRVTLFGSSLGRVAQLSDNRFIGGVLMSGARVELVLAFTSNEVGGDAKFDGIRCSYLFIERTSDDDGKLVGGPSVFHGAVDMGKATVTNDIRLSDCIIHGPASFNGLHTANFDVVRATEDETPLTVHQSATFDSSTIDHTLNLSYARFLHVPNGDEDVVEGLNLNHLTVGWIVNLRNIYAAGNVSANAIRCSGGLFLEEAELTGRQVDLRFAEIGMNIQTDRATIPNGIDFESARIGQELDISSGLGGLVDLLNAKVERLQISLPLNCHVDLRGLVFTRLIGGEAAAGALTRAQQVESLDPYLQLEKHFNQSGEAAAAKRIYYLGRVRAGKVTSGPLLSQLACAAWDLLLRVLIGYGVYPHRVLVASTVALAVGFFVYLPSGNLEPRQAPVPIAGPASSQAPGAPGPSLIDTVGFDIDTFLPVVNLRAEDSWKPVGALPVLYSYVHATLGWLLALLLVASWSGLVRRGP